TVAFIGHLVAGPLGAVAAAIAVFLPCYLLVIFPAPYFRRISAHAGVRAFVDGVTAAAVGAIAGAAFVLGKRAIFDWPTAVLALSAYVLLWKVKGLPEPLLIVAAGVVGVLLTSG
ncbi:MAG TPA: chromate transporter, partial [Bryobacteraceae bacterium]|nr:chromate transporter [Bryobacteraceae bacterium]